MADCTLYLNVDIGFPRISTSSARRHSGTLFNVGYHTGFSYHNALTRFGLSLAFQGNPSNIALCIDKAEVCRVLSTASGRGVTTATRRTTETAEDGRGKQRCARRQQSACEAGAALRGVDSSRARRTRCSTQCGSRRGARR
jgi:hypothetical protein